MSGVGEDIQRVIWGTVVASGEKIKFQEANGSFELKDIATSYTATTGQSTAAALSFGFWNSRTVKIGNENIPRHYAERFFRRTS